MKVTTAEMRESDKRNRIQGGLVIKIVTSDNIVKADYLEIEVEHKSYYFQVVEVSTDGDNLKATAIERGYFAHKLGRNSNMDLRTLVGSDVSIITDKDKVAMIVEKSCWC